MPENPTENDRAWDRFEATLPQDLRVRLRTEAEHRGLTSAEALFEALDEVLPQAPRRGIGEFERGGVRYQLVRLRDGQYREFAARSLPIREDVMFQLQLFHPRFARQDEPRETLGLAQTYAVMRHLFGESSTFFDDYKGSFNFLFSLYIHRFDEEASRRYHYLMEFTDWKGGPEFRFRKVVPRAELPAALIDRDVIRPPFEAEFSLDEMRYFMAHFVGYLEGYFQATSNIYQKDFFRTVPAKLIVYGYAGGMFFDENYDSQEEFATAIAVASRGQRPLSSQGLEE